MAKKKSIDDLADEILRDFDAGDTPARRAHLAEAQRQIAALDPTRDAQTVQRLQAQALALQGRGGDTEIAHVTPGEFVIPAADARGDASAGGHGRTGGPRSGDLPRR